MARALTRLLTSALLLFALSFAMFGVLSALPGDPIDLLVTSNPNIRPDDVARLKKLRGLDQPWPVQWARWLIGHREPRSPPPPTFAAPVVVELPAEGPAVVTMHGVARPYTRPGVYDEATVVPDAAEPALESVAVDPVLVAPTLSLVPSPPEEAPHGLDESDRQLGGSGEHASGVGRASETELADAARKAGRALDIAPVHVIEAGADGSVDVDPRSLAAANLAFDVVTGPGTFASGHYRAHFDGPGRSAVIFRATAPDGTVARGAFLVEHGTVFDPAHFHHGAVFALLGDGEALGYSSAYKRPVVELLRGRVTNTLILMVPALLLALLVAVPLGTFAAARRGRAVDRLIVGASIASLSIPPFWLGLMGIVVLAAKLNVLPAGGMSTPGLTGVDAFVDVVVHATLPVLVLAVGYAGPFVRYVRSGVVDVLPLDFVRTARAKGAGPRAVLRHALQNALLPLVTVVGLAAPQMFAGALLTETVFAWPGIGRLQYDSILNNDSYVAVVVFLITAAIVLAANVAADALYAVVDPRLRRRR